MVVQEVLTMLVLRPTEAPEVVAAKADKAVQGSRIKDSMVLRAGEQVQLSLFPHEPITASTIGPACRLAVMRQD